MEKFPTFKDSWPWPWLGSYCMPSCITYQLYLQAKFHCNWRNYFLWMDRRTPGRTFETHFIRSTQKSRPNHSIKNQNQTNWAKNVWTLQASCGVYSVAMRWMIRSPYVFTMVTHYTAQSQCQQNYYQLGMRLLFNLANSYTFTSNMSAETKCRWFSVTITAL